MRRNTGSAVQQIDAPHYNYWQAFYQSFYNARLYVDVGKRWRGLSIGYLLFVILIVSLPLSARLMLTFNRFFNQNISMPLSRLPTLFIQNGVVNLDKPMPYFVKNDSGAVIAIVDTSGTINSFTNQYPQLSILVTRDKLFYRIPSPPTLFQNDTAIETPVSVQSFDKEMNQVFDGQQWVQSSGLTTIRIVTELLIYPTLVFLFFTVSLIFFLAFGLMAQLIANLLLKFSPSYVQTFRLLMVSATPQMIVLLLVLAFNMIMTGIGMVLIILLATYFSFAVLSMKRDSNKLVQL